MGSNDHLPIEQQFDPLADTDSVSVSQPKPIAELLAGTMERNRISCSREGNWPPIALKQLDEDVPRLVKALEFAWGILNCSLDKSNVDRMARILSGQEENTDA